jgi:AP-4 complex subunit epsilon-1
MAACLNIFYDMSVANPWANKDLTSTFVNILKQVIESRLPKDFEYHKVPAPWVQLKLLRILAVLGADDQACVDMFIVLFFGRVCRALFWACL